jgi:hypothetical protein
MTRTQFVNAHVQAKIAFFLVFCHPKNQAMKQTLISFEPLTGSSDTKGQSSESFTLKKQNTKREKCN